MRCSICASSFEAAHPDYIPVGETEKPICPSCKKQLNHLLNSQNPQELQQALHFLYTSCNTIQDPMLADALRRMCVKHNARLRSITSAAGMLPDASASDEVYRKTTWLRILRATALILLAVSLLAGLVNIIAIFESDSPSIFVPVLAIACPLLGLLIAAGIMTFANMAEDTREIRRLLSRSQSRGQWGPFGEDH